MSFFDLRGFVLGCIIVAILLVSKAIPLVPNVVHFFQFRLALSRVVSCMDEENATVCARPAVKKMLELKSGAEVMDLLSVDFTPQRCHYIGHVVGQESFSQQKNVEVAIAQCNRSCDSACIHGVIGQAFADELGYNTSDDVEGIDLKHLNIDEMRTVGRRLCTSIGTCHGVGHALFQIYEEFTPAFSVCREIAGPMLNQCYNGVTMEYADNLSSRSISTPSDTSLKSQESLRSLCNFPSITESRACFRYFPRMVFETLKTEGFNRAQSLTFVREICEAHESVAMRIVCFGGFGSYASYFVLTDTSAAVQSCEWLESQQAKAACMIGTLAVATEDRVTALVAYCAATVDPTLQSTCYQGLFFFLSRVGVPITTLEVLCTHDDRCREGLKNHTMDPVERIKNFTQ